MINHFCISKSDNIAKGAIVIPLIAGFQLILKGKNFTHYKQTHKEIIIIGDLVDTQKILFDTKTEDIPKLKGTFYAIVLEKGFVKVFNSFLSILPIYHTSGYECISSSINCILESVPTEFTKDKKFILESLLFNYGFFNRTLYKEISLVPSNHFIQIDASGITFHKHFETTSLFTKTPMKGKKAALELSDFFIVNAKSYFPNKKVYIAFTSGFDGRTLVSCASHYQKEFETFSFGRSENADVIIPKSNAEALEIPYRYFDLGNTAYLKTCFLENALEYIDQYPGGNGFIYPHFLYSTKEIAKDSEYLISGAMGSELFRALHLTGAVTSRALVDVFTSNTSAELSDKIKNANVLKPLRLEYFSTELDELIEELIDYKNKIPVEYTKNQQFYIFVFDEIFRKFFGQWIYLQMMYVNLRIPFLDYKFIKKLLQTQYAGANNDFFTENPLKRMKGQFLYADIIKKTNKTIYNQKTGKGYRPKDVRESLFLPNIVIPFLKKRLYRNVKQVNLDNLGIVTGVLSQKNTFLQLIEQTEWLHARYLSEKLENLTPFTNEKERDMLLMTIALSKALQKT